MKKNDFTSNSDRPPSQFSLSGRNEDTSEASWSSSLQSQSQSQSSYPMSSRWSSAAAASNRRPGDITTRHNPGATLDEAGVCLKMRGVGSRGGDGGGAGMGVGVNRGGRRGDGRAVAEASRAPPAAGAVDAASAPASAAHSAVVGNQRPSSPRMAAPRAQLDAVRAAKIRAKEEAAATAAVRARIRARSRAAAGARSDNEADADADAATAAANGRRLRARAVEAAAAEAAAAARAGVGGTDAAAATHAHPVVHAEGSDGHGHSRDGGRFGEPPPMTERQLAEAGLGWVPDAASAAASAAATGIATGGTDEAAGSSGGVGAEARARARGDGDDRRFPADNHLAIGGHDAADAGRRNHRGGDGRSDFDEPDFSDQAAQEVLDAGVGGEIEVEDGTGGRSDAASGAASADNVSQVSRPIASEVAPTASSSLDPPVVRTDRGLESAHHMEENVEERNELPTAVPVDPNEDDDYIDELVGPRDDVSNNGLEGLANDPERLRRLLDPVVVIATPAPREDSFDRFDDIDIKPNEGGIVGWAKRNLCIAAFAVLAVVTGIVAAAVVTTTNNGGGGGVSQGRGSGGGGGGGRGASPSPTVGPLSPTAIPTPRPTFAPVTGELAAFVPVLEPVSVPQSLFDPKSAAGRAMQFLADEGGKWADTEADPDKVRQRFALVALYYATGGDSGETVVQGGGGGWTEKFKFLSDSDECDWSGTDSQGTLKGVRECNENGQVVDIYLPRNNLTGSLPLEIQGLTALRSLILAQNSIGGSIPLEITRLASLQDIRLFDNAIVGSLPQTLGDLDQLTYVAMQNNRIGGPMPPNIGNANLITDLILQENSMTGSLPTSMGNMTSMQELFLEVNQFTGTIPSEMGNMVSLRNIWLSQNSFTGGMEVFCNGNINIALFYADCLGTSFPETPPQVRCPCCTICCNEDEDCLPNN